MPDKEVKTIQDLIFFQYAKIIAKSAMCGKGDLNGDGGAGCFGHRRDYPPRQRIDFKPDSKSRGADCASPSFHFSKRLCRAYH